jgi:predicted HTH domain antitoxin
MKLEVPDQYTARLEPAEVLLDLAMGMYASGHLTLGQAAELAGIPQAELQRELGRRQIPAHYDLDDLAHDLRASSEMLRQ